MAITFLIFSSIINKWITQLTGNYFSLQKGSYYIGWSEDVIFCINNTNYERLSQMSRNVFPILQNYEKIKKVFFLNPYFGVSTYKYQKGVKGPFIKNVDWIMKIFDPLLHSLSSLLHKLITFGQSLLLPWCQRSLRMVPVDE